MRKLVLSILLLPTVLFADDAARRRAIEQNLATTVLIEGVRGPTLEQRMKQLGVPAVSYAVVEDGKIVLAGAVGLADVESGRAATTATMFQAASISKPVAAIGAMELVERGALSLDAPVNTILTSWKLPENELTAKTPVSLRLLLSHTAGTTVHGFPGYAPDEPRPTLLQVLKGERANTAPVTVDLAPNTKARYSGGGTTVAQAVLTDHTGLPFATFMRRAVLGPLGMTNSTYEQPLPPARRNAAATGYRFGSHEVDGKWHIYPEQAAAGLWTTPSDLAKVIIEMHHALAGRETKVLTIDGARHMLTPRLEAGTNASIGIGFFIEDRNGVKYFGHGGSNEGFRATLLASLDGSKGAVVMTNSDTGAAVANDVLATIAREYGWSGYAAQALPSLPISEADAERFAGRYEMTSGQVVHIRRSANGLEFLDLAEGWMPLYLLPNQRLVRVTRDTQFELVPRGSSGSTEFLGGADDDARRRDTPRGTPRNPEEPAPDLMVIARASSPKPARIPARRLPSDALSAAEFMAMGRIDEAVAAYRAQHQAKPLTEEDLGNAAWSLFEAGRVPEWVALLRLFTELHPSSARGHERLARGLMLSGDRAGAIAALEETQRRVDSDPKLTKEQRERLRDQARRRIEKLRRSAA